MYFQKFSKTTTTMNPLASEASHTQIKSLGQSVKEQVRTVKDNNIRLQRKPQTPRIPFLDFILSLLLYSSPQLLLHQFLDITTGEDYALVSVSLQKFSRNESTKL